MPANKYLFALLLSLPFAARAQTPGCTDIQATNYSAAATQNDGSCAYAAATVTPAASYTLSDTVKETSGLIFWQNTFWTMNDDTDPAIYALDTTDGHIIRRIAIQNVVNNDWEEISQDNNYIYIGDFGNNLNGNRQNLKILRIAKQDIINGQTSVAADTIAFSYPDQTSFTPTGSNNTDFDCEAFIATADSLYLFTKQWVSQKTKVYTLPKTPGTYTATAGTTLDVQGLITGATYIAAKKMVALIGYNYSPTSLQPFLYLLYDFQGNKFFSANKRKIQVNLPFHQTEGITTIDGRRFFLSNEKIVQSIITITPKLHKLDLNPYLNNYYQSLHVTGATFDGNSIRVFPTPFDRELTVQLTAAQACNATCTISDLQGKIVYTTTRALSAGANQLTLQPAALSPGGNYLLSVMNNETQEQSTVKLVHR